ncbi:unnamed protein product [Chrysodeixis includens]|uniref:Uncharacterized protein n=1 Tax=Chrysodeixis includens TaxID=689277 RepID=A0A9N8L187_CHRIL|nr:unnamed protein product [Chrysodeixis includens]
MYHSKDYECEMTVLKEEPLEKKDGEDIVLEKIFSKFRPLGPYYMRLMPLLIFACMSNALYCMNYVFAVVMVDYRCKYAACANSTSWSQLAQNLTLDTCHKYSLSDNNGTCSIDSYNVSNYQDCKEWTYDDPLSFVADKPTPTVRLPVNRTEARLRSGETEIY